MTLMANLRLLAPELVLFSLAAAWAAGCTSEIVAGLGALALIFAAGVAAEEIIHRYSRRQGRHGQRLT